MNSILVVIQRFFKERFHDQSAQMAYYFMLSIFPFLIFSFSLLRFLPINLHELLDAIKPFTPKGTYELLQMNALVIFEQQTRSLASFSLVVAFWIASLAVQSLVRAMNDAYYIVRKERFLIALGKDLVLTGSLMITLALSLLVPIGEEFGRVFLSSRVDFPPSFYTSWLFIKWLIGSIYLFFFFIFIYKTVPSTKIAFSHTIPGALFATVGWQVVSIAFTYYVTYFANFSRLYGYIGNFIVLMSWFYLTAAVLLIGGLLNASWISIKNQRQEVKNEG